MYTIFFIYLHGNCAYKAISPAGQLLAKIIYTLTFLELNILWSSISQDAKV